MKKIALVTAISTLFSAYALAGENFMDKVLNFYSVTTNGLLNFEAKKIEDGYKLRLSPKIKEYKELLNPNYPITVTVDEGPLVTKPHFTFAKAGLLSNIELFKLFNKRIQEELNKNIKKSPLLHYEAIVSFSGILTEDFLLDPIIVEDKEMRFTLSALKAKSRVDLNKYTGALDITTKSLKIESKKEDGNIEFKSIKVHNEITQTPVNNIVLFGKSSFAIENVKVAAKSPQPISLDFSFDMKSEIKKVNEKFLDFMVETKTKTNDVNTIALSKGIKESDTKLIFKNLGTKGVLELIAFNQKIEETQNKLLQSANDPAQKEKALAEYINQMAMLNKKITEILNAIFISGKSKIILDLNLLGEKSSFVKLDLLYKAKPLQGDINSAIISLAAQGLSIFDGTFEVQVDRDLANSAYPMASLFLEMLRAKGFVTEKNGIYHLKGELKGGKVIINNKAYTLEELTATLIQ